MAALMRRKVDFFPAAVQARNLRLLKEVGTRVASGLHTSAHGATTEKFAAATQVAKAPLSAWGPYRVGEDGRLYLVTKSEHYHAPLGHAFPGYRLIDFARAAGIPNATHNNTRGHITRTLEEELIRAANGADGDGVGSTGEHSVLNRVLNLETGSLAVEAAIKICLARFYQIQPDAPSPCYAGRVPVLVVIGDQEGGLQANYHGTTIVAQAMRGMWSPLMGAFEKNEILLVRAVRPNNLKDLEAVFRKYDRGRYKIAGFFHELVLMNYGSVVIELQFVHRAYELCRKHDVPTVVDEIQTGIWSHELFMFREYGLSPSMVAIGKGFPGGEYPASRILFNGQLDCLPQFGALVTNGQEELAALSYLITMRWARANAEITRKVGDHYETCLRELGDRHRKVINSVEGVRHLAAVRFADVATAKRFTGSLNEMGLDISVQTYKAATPPTALTKLPLICGYEIVDFVIERMNEALKTI